MTELSHTSDPGIGKVIAEAMVASMEHNRRYRVTEFDSLPVPPNIIFRWHARNLSNLQLSIWCSDDGEPRLWALKRYWEYP